MLSLKMEEGSFKPRNAYSLQKVKRAFGTRQNKIDSPLELPEQNATCLIFSSVRPVLDIWPTEP